MNKWHSYHYNAVHYPKRLQPGNVFNPVYAGGSANFHADLYHNGHYHKGMYYNGELVWRRYDTAFHRGWIYEKALDIVVPEAPELVLMYSDKEVKGTTLGVFALLDEGDYEKIIEDSQGDYELLVETGQTGCPNDTHFETTYTEMDSTVFEDGVWADMVERTRWLVIKKHKDEFPDLKYLWFNGVKVPEKAPVRYFGYIANHDNITCFFELKTKAIGGICVLNNNSIELEVRPEKSVSYKRLKFYTSEYCERNSIIPEKWNVIWCDLGPLKVRHNPPQNHYYRWYEYTYKIKGNYWRWYGIYEHEHFYTDDWIDPVPEHSSYFHKFDGEMEHEKIDYDLEMKPDIITGKEIPKGIVEILAKHNI